MIRAVIFDFDGVILDTETPDFISWREVFVAHGAELTMESWAQGIGAGPGAFDVYAHLASLSTHAVEVEAIRNVRRARNDALVAGEAPMPGVEAWLDEARRLGLKTGIASSSPSEWVEGHTTRLSLRGYFDCIRCRDQVGLAKPAPELYEAVCAAVGVAAGEAMAIEDSPNGIAAAKAAGLFCLAVPNAITATLDLSAADLRVESLAAASLESVIANLT